MALQPPRPQVGEFLLFGSGLPRPEVVGFVVAAEVEVVVACAALLGPSFLVEPGVVAAASTFFVFLSQ